MTRNAGEHVGPAIPPGVLEKMMELCPEYSDLDYDELLEHQESVFQSLKGIDRGSTSTQSNVEHDYDSQLALDEALARTLQDMENELEDFSLYELPHISSEEPKDGPGPSEQPNNDVYPDEETSVAAAAAADHVGEDVIDPDNMSYEELQSLGESMGTESRGLSEKAISKLPTTRFIGSGWLFKKQDKENCPICCTPYKRGEKQTVLPCKHLYHPQCIKTWLMNKKNCPLCKLEIHSN